ncbi:MAG: DUF2867 domain-containing protein [Gluconacetobacter diazotrophicus]|nr:DUF2867 domain-containing protein [Gluconacetobacter diazotrophicus]
MRISRSRGGPTRERTTINRVEPPGGWTDPRYAGATLLDSFSVRLPPHAPDDAYRLSELALSDPPSGFRLLMRVRDTIMSRLGVKSSGEIGASAEGRGRIDFFPVLGRTEREVELGAEDRHLDFRTWLTIRGSGAERTFASTTAATAHNWLGRSYLAVIGPFHVAVVRSSLRRMLRRLG